MILPYGFGKVWSRRFAVKQKSGLIEVGIDRKEGLLDYIGSSISYIGMHPVAAFEFLP
jgi:hypothetical protein